MGKEDGWEDYFCHECGKLVGHYYVGFPQEKEKLAEMKAVTARSLCPEHRKVIK